MKQKKQKYSRLFHPRSIAVIGASGTKGKAGHTIARNVQSYGFDGDVYFVNPHRTRILGKKVWPSIDAIGVDIDCAIVVVPAPVVEQTICDARHCCKNFVVISAGFGESGIDGHNREERLHALAKKYRLTILGPNCLGFLVPSLGLNASFADGMPEKGRIALISQSGALAVATMDRCQRDHIGFSFVASIGNKMQLDAADMIAHVTDDAATEYIFLYLEGVRTGTKFLQSIAKAHRAGKKVFVLKAGRTQNAQKAIALHTGSLAGDDEVFCAALQKVGAVFIETIDDFFTMMLLCAKMRTPLTSPVRIGVVTNAGGPGVLVTDTIAQSSVLRMAKLLRKTTKTLQKDLPAFASAHNPIDVLGDAHADRYARAIDALIADSSVDVIVVILTPQGQTPVAAVARVVAKAQQKTKKCIVASFIGGERVHKAIAFLQNAGVLHVDAPQEALRTLATLVSQHKPFSLTAPKPDSTRRRAMTRIFQNAKQNGGLYFADTAAVAKLYHIPVAPFVDITDGFDAKQRIPYPCIAKVDNPAIMHKTDRGGIVPAIKNLAELDAARKALLRTFAQKDTRIIVQPYLPKGMELIIGMKRDPIFGVIVVAGLGGIYTEAFHVVDRYVAPLTLSEITKRLTTGVLAFLFDGTRGEASYHKDVIARIIHSIAVIGMENPEIVAIDMNPLLIYNNDTADVAVDYKIIINI